MGDWFRSATVLVIAFVGLVVVTIGLANLIVPGRAVGPGTADGGGGGATPAPTIVPIEGIGGHLTVTGDRTGTLTVTQESNDDRYSLESGNARIVFEGSRPPTVAQLSWEGLEFFPEPGDCTVTPGELDDEIGVGYTEIRCEGLTDIRSGEVIDLAGTLGLALTTVGESDLPDMGGSVTAGDETWEFDEALLFAFAAPAVVGTEDYNMVLTDEAHGVLRFRYDVQTHRLTLVEVERGGDVADLGAGACSLGTNELGRLAPGVAIVALSIDCPAADVPGLGTVPISGTIVIQNLEFFP